MTGSDLIYSLYWGVWLDINYNLYFGINWLLKIVLHGFAAKKTGRFVLKWNFALDSRARPFLVVW